jgi:hypothetical protein
MGSPQVCKIVALKTECRDPNGTTSDYLACFLWKPLLKNTIHLQQAPRPEHMLTKPT